MKSAHSVHASAGWGRGRAQENILRGSCVTAPRGTDQELAKIHGATRDIAADEIRVHAFECCRRENAALEDAVAKARSKTLDLTFDPIEHVEGRSVGNMAVGPRDVTVSRSPRGIEQCGLREQHERAFGVFAFPHAFFRRCDVFESTTQVHRGSAQTIAGGPWNRVAQSVIDLEGSRAVAVFCQLASI